MWLKRSLIAIVEFFQLSLLDTWLTYIYQYINGSERVEYISQFVTTEYKNECALKSYWLYKPGIFFLPVFTVVKFVKGVICNLMWKFIAEVINFEVIDLQHTANNCAN